MSRGCAFVMALWVLFLVLLLAGCAKPITGNGHIEITATTCTMKLVTPIQPDEV